MRRAKIPDTRETAVPTDSDSKGMFSSCLYLTTTGGSPPSLHPPTGDELFHSSFCTSYESQRTSEKCHHTSTSTVHCKDSAFTTAVHAANEKCLTTRHALFFTFT